MWGLTSNPYTVFGINYITFLIGFFLILFFILFKSFLFVWCFGILLFCARYAKSKSIAITDVPLKFFNSIIGMTKPPYPYQDRRKKIRF